jgi:hypothetical protein
MNNGERNRREELEKLAVQTAAALYCRVLKEPLDSPRLQRLKDIANRANARAERRYKASIEP